MSIKNKPEYAIVGANWVLPILTLGINPEIRCDTKWFMFG